MSPRTILVADEDTDTRIILRALLERHGYSVVEASNADEAMAASEQDLSLVIMNHPMPAGTQTTLARWLRAQPRTRDVPIINLTSRTVPYYIEDAAQQGVTVTMVKPIDVKTMLNLVHQFTDQLVVR